MDSIYTWTKQWYNWFETNILKLKCCLFFPDLLPKSPTVCYSTTAASMRNMTSSPWKSSTSRYNSPSLQVVYLFFIIMIYGNRFSPVSYHFCPEFVLVIHFFDCFPGETKTTVSPYILGGVSDGQWHVVEVHYYNKVQKKFTKELLLKHCVSVETGL